MSAKITLFTSDGQEVSNIVFDNVKLGNQSLVQHFRIKNTGDVVIDSLQVQASFSEVEQLGSAEETYEATFISQNGIDFRHVLNYQLNVNESKDLFIKWKVPSYLKLDNVKEHKKWGLKFVISLNNTNVEAICGT